MFQTDNYGYNNDPNMYNNYPPKSNNHFMIVILVILACLAVVSVIAAAIVLTGVTAEVAPPQLIITSCAESVTSDDPNVTISGMIQDDKYPCVLTINGETVETAMNPKTPKSWSKTYEIPEGETKTFTITLKNEKDKSVTETRQVYCHKIEEPEATPKKNTVTGPLRSGCEFVKKKSGGLNIRAYAGTEYEVIDYIDDYDYTSKMIYTGYCSIDYEGYTWYEVISPNGKNGYVRSDLVERIS